MMHLQEVVFILLLLSRFCAPSAINGSSPLTLSRANAAISFGEKTTNLAEQLVDAANNDKLLRSLKILSACFGFAGSIVGVATAFIPDMKHRQVLQEMNEIKTKIDAVRDDIKNLEEKLDWEVRTQILYAEATTTITLGIGYAEQIPTYSSYRQRLKNLCEGQKYEQAMKILFHGLVGTGYFRNDIFNSFYHYTKGDITKISKLGDWMIRLVTGGLTTLLTCDAMTTNLTSAECHVESFYSGKVDNVTSKIAAVLKKCKDNFKHYAQEDLEQVMEEYSSMEKKVYSYIGSSYFLAGRIRGKLSDRYPWLNFTVIVYDDVYGGDKHTIDNSIAIYKLRFHGKCAIAFYTEKENAGMNRSVENNVESYAKKVASRECLEWKKRAWWGSRCVRQARDAESAYDAMAAYLRKYDYDYYGLACFYIPEGNDFQCQGCDSVWVRDWRSGYRRKRCVYGSCSSPPSYRMIIIVQFVL